MTQDEIIEFGKQVGMEAFHYPELIPKDTWEKVEAFTKLVAEHEREECAKLCEDSVEYAGGELASQIRARGQS